MALEKTKSVSPGLSDPVTTAGAASSEDETQFSREEGPEPRLSWDDLTFQGDKAQLISGSGWLIIQRCVDAEKSRIEIISDSRGTTAQKLMQLLPWSFFFMHTITACNRRSGSVFPLQQGHVS